MTVKDEVRNLIVTRKPKALCDDCITTILSISGRQHANHKTIKLEREEGFPRHHGRCSVCAGEKKVIQAP